MKCYLSAFKSYLAFQKEALSTLPDRFQSDNGVEMTNSGLQSALRDIFTNQSYSTPYVKAQNGLVEAKIKNLVNTTTSILLTSKLPVYLWNILLETAAYLINLRYRETLKSSPYVKFLGFKSSIDHLRVIGTPN